MPKLHHASVAFGLIVGEGNRRIVKEAQRVPFACCEAQEEIMSGSARRTAAPFAASLHRGSRQRHLGLMLSLSQMSSGWRGTTNRVMLSPDVGRLQIAVVPADRVLPIARVT